MVIIPSISHPCGGCFRARRLLPFEAFASVSNVSKERHGAVVAGLRIGEKRGIRMRQTYLVQRQRGYRAWALAPLLIACLLLAACASSTGRATVSAPTATIPAKWQGVNMGSGAGMPTVTPLADSTPRPLPAFSDPRVAYIGPDSLRHVVSLDGATDLAGTPIPLNGSPMDGIWGAGTSPDGKHLAYFEDARITTIDAASGTRTALPAPGGDSTVGWSPDQRYLTLQEGGAIECVSATNGGSFETPGDPLTLLATSKWQIGPMAG